MASLSAININGTKYDFIYGHAKLSDQASIADNFAQQENININIPTSPQSAKYVVPQTFYSDVGGGLTGATYFGARINQINVLQNYYSQGNSYGLNPQNSAFLPKHGSTPFTRYQTAAGHIGGTISNFGNFYSLNCNIGVVGRFVKTSNTSVPEALKNNSILMKISSQTNIPRLIGAFGFKGNSEGFATQAKKTGKDGFTLLNSPASFAHLDTSPWAFTVPVSIQPYYTGDGLYLRYNGPDIIPDWISSQSASLPITTATEYTWSTRLCIQASWIEETDF